MKRVLIKRVLLVVILSLACQPSVLARDLSAIVSADWLEKNLNDPRLIVLDIRKVEEYREGHIPGAVNAYFGTWAGSKDGKAVEIPQEDDLFDAMGNAGMRPDSHVVVTCHTAHCYFQVESARVFCTLQYGGLENVGVLDGGYEQWVRENKPVSREIVKPEKTVYKAKLNRTLLAEKDYVAGRLGKALFVDVREPVFFRGEKKQSFVEKAGRIPGAVNLPASEAYTATGTFKKKEELEAVAAKILGADKSREIITYCDAGKCCPTWAFILREVLGYRDVKLYDGSFEEWTRDTNLPVTR